MTANKISAKQAGESSIFEAVFAASPLPMMIVDGECRIRKMNAAIGKMLGEEPLGRRMGEALRCAEHSDSLQPCGRGPKCHRCELRRSVVETYKSGKPVSQVELELTLRLMGREETRLLMLSTAPLGSDADRLVLLCLEDVTERRRTERTLRESQQRLIMAQTAGRVGVFDWDMIADVIVVTPEAEVNYGLPPGAERYRYEDFLKRLHPDDATWVQEEVRLGLLEKVPEMEMVFRIVRPDGGVRWISQRAIVSYNAAGEGVRMVGTSRDITEQKEAEEGLRRSEEKFSSAFRLSPDSININRLSDGVYVDVNEGFTKITGYTREDVLGKSSLPRELGIWVRSEDRERMVAGLKEKGEVTGLEAEFRRKDGTTLTGLMSARLFDMHGDMCVLSITRDITEAKNAREALRESELRFRGFMESEPAACILFDPQLNYLYFNPAAEKFTGIALAEARGKNIADFIPAVLRSERYTQYMEVLRTGVPCHMESVMPNRELFGDRVFSVNAFKVGENLGVIWSDITERYQNEKALRERETELVSAHAITRALIDTASDLILLLDPGGKIIELNEAAARRISVKREELLGRNAFEFFDKETAERRRARVSSVFQTGQSLEFEDSRDGRYYRNLLRPLINADGTVRAVAIYATDMTERRKLEEQLLQAQKMEAIGQLAGGIAHDFRNQLTVIICCAELLREGTHVLPAGQKMVEEIRNAAQQSADMTGKLLGFSRKQMLQPMLVDVGELTEEICRTLPRLLGESVKLQVSAEVGSLTASLDPVQYQQAIFNLATNARDAMPQGGAMSIRCFRMQPDDAFRNRHPEATAASYVAVAVSDTGEGMDEATAARIFEPFFTTKPSGQGTGLGLPMVYGFLSQCGGFITVHSALREGTTICLHFQEADSGGVVQDDAQSKGAVPTGNERVLVVEDESAVREMVTLFLKGAGYRVSAAANDDESLGLLGAEPFDLMITDVVMPGMGGPELARRARQAHAGMRVMFMTGYADLRRGEAGISSVTGADLLTKPFGRVDLLKAVRRALER
jgi:PAS domain S-box-containing protein